MWRICDADQEQRRARSVLVWPELARGSRVVATMIVCSLATGVAGVVTQSASASAIILNRAVVEASPSLTIRTGPSTAYQPVGSASYGTTFGVWCVEYGAAVAGPWGTTTIWDFGNIAGVGGFVSDAWVYTGTMAATAPACNTDGRNL